MFSDQKRKNLGRELGSSRYTSGVARNRVVRPFVAGLPNGSISGQLSTNNSSTGITFSPSNTTTGFGTLPGVNISGASGSFTYQVAQTFLSLQAPTVGNPVGDTSIQGAVTDTSAPEPTTIVLMGAGLGLLGMLRRRAAR